MGLTRIIHISHHYSTMMSPHHHHHYIYIYYILYIAIALALAIVYSITIEGGVLRKRKERVGFHPTPSLLLLMLSRHCTVHRSLVLGTVRACTGIFGGSLTVLLAVVLCS